jgi:alkylated DNA nucleotide flippase Atl1
MATSAIDKIKAGGDPQIVQPLPERVAHWGPPGGSMVISTPAEVDALIATIPKGRLATINTLRSVLAQRHKVDVACPVTTGIFASIAAKAAAEREMMGAKRVTPWWRVIKSDGTLNPKMPGGLDEHRKRLESEGFTIVKKGRSSLAVADFEKKLAKLD